MKQKTCDHCDKPLGGSYLTYEDDGVRFTVHTECAPPDPPRTEWDDAYDRAAARYDGEGKDWR